MPSLLPRTTRILRTLPARPHPPSLNPRIHTHTRSLTSKPAPPQLDAISLHRLEATRRAHHKRRTIYSATGFLAGMICIWVTATSIELPPPNKLDSAQRDARLPPDTPVVVSHAPADADADAAVPTGTSTVPTFPRALHFGDDATGPAHEYQLLGLGIRTVSFLGIQVYVVGLYVKRTAMPTLQAALLRQAAPEGATTLVAGEREALRALLMQEGRGEEIWSEILREAGVDTIVRIVPTRNTDFHHLRDAWVRGLTARAQRDRAAFGDAAFGEAVAAFKGLFHRGSVPKGRELLLARDGAGKLSVWYEDGKAGQDGKVQSQRLGEVRDERVSRSIWLGYLAGAQVSSEEARRNIVEGVMGLVERPVGTVEGQVHV
ncbi:hypothetical protein MFRU_012g01580 [Monilinia fructicola]|nr:hypothetical protein MFRU_012g01580 [Monilinia fructicola]